MRALLNYTDLELITLLRQGELTAFDELYYRYVPKVLGFAKTFILDKDEAEEAVQEVFIKIWEKRDTLKSELNFKSYLFVAVKNQVYNKLRNAKKFVRVEDLEIDVASTEMHVDDELAYHELEQATFGLLDQLPQIQKKVFTLNKLEGLSHKEIAAMLNISVRTVEHHVYLASKQLRASILQHASIVSVFVVFMLNS
ncbi:RNA polymerase sigma-70 factor [Echinicola sp. CAU 1574]|uniref:RNA polymerase sigma-70 factor n=1 Tax=Echinicola arenosa TaxID=2774144 RepID=A0ABR9AGH7_9BACT|nr:RNA polymerase sigma-70 factor [Echinicola arenosa]MBD8487780.1 RNA polymerase sigma-70 factor [Echinicola arenosa]